MRRRANYLASSRNLRAKTDRHSQRPSKRRRLLLESLETRLPLAQAEFIPLGILPGQPNSQVRDISPDGQYIVGNSGTEAFRWSPSEGMVGLGTFIAKDISANGAVVVGNDAGNQGNAYRWENGNLMTIGDLTTIGRTVDDPGGVRMNVASGISTDGAVIVGNTGVDSKDESDSFRIVGSEIIPIGDVLGGAHRSNVGSVSDDGSVVVGAATSADGPEIFHWEDGVFTTLGFLPGGTNGVAWAVSGNGQYVTGNTGTGAGPEAFLWSQEGGMIGLGHLPGETTDSRARAVTNDGSIVVGIANLGQPVADLDAFIWDAENGMRNLQEVLTNEYGLGDAMAGWTLNGGQAISHDGLTIAGAGTNPDGALEAFVVRLEVEPPPAEFIPIPFLPDQTDSAVWAVSPDGRFAVGRSGDESWRWSESEGTIPLGTFGARDVSADGSVVVGRGADGSAQRWENGTLSAIGDLTTIGRTAADPGGTQIAVATGVSADGSIVVGNTDTDSKDESDSFRIVGAEIQPIGDLPGGGHLSYTSGVSADGSVVIGGGQSDQGNQAYRWENGTFMPLGDLPGGEFESIGFRVSSNGQFVVGNSRSAAGQEAFLWSSESGMVGLGHLPGETTDSRAWGVSNNGIAVGAGNQGQSLDLLDAFIWDEQDGMQNLQDVLVTEYGLGDTLAGWTLNGALDISDDGLTIGGWGTNPSGLGQAFVVRLEAASPIISIGDATAREGGDAWSLAETFESDEQLADFQAWDIVRSEAGDYYATVSDGISGIMKIDGQTGAVDSGFVSPGTAGLDKARELAIRGDWIYVGNKTTNEVLRFELSTGAPDPAGAFIALNDQGLQNPRGLAFDDAGNLFLISKGTDQIVRYDSQGNFLGQFAADVTSTSTPNDLTISSAGEIYITGDGKVLRYSADGTSQGVFADAGSDLTTSIEFGPDGDLYVGNGNDGGVLRFDGSTGALKEVVANDGFGQKQGLAFDGAGSLFIANNDQSTTRARVLRHSSSSAATFTVTLSAASDSSVTVDFVTADGTAMAGSDYAATSGTLHFAPGQVTRTLVVSAVNDTDIEPDETFFVNLSNPTGGATVEDNQAVATIVDDDTPRLSISNVTVVEGDTSLREVDEFIVEGSGGLANPRSSIVGPDGNLYVGSLGTNEILRYDGQSGAFIDVFVASGILDNPAGLQFSPVDGHLYVASVATNEVHRFNGQTGAYIDTPVNELDQPLGIAFNNDGDLFIANLNSDDIRRYDGSTLSTFVSMGSGGLETPRNAVFGPDGNLYVSSQGTSEILRYNGETGAFLDVFSTLPRGPNWIEFGPDGTLYVTLSTSDTCCDRSFVRIDSSGAIIDELPLGRDGWSFTLDPNGVIYNSSNGEGSFLARIAPRSAATFTVSLSEAVGETVTVDFATTEGSATAGGDFMTTSGQVVFVPGQLSRTILVPTLDDAEVEPDETFFVNLSNPTGGAAVADAQAVATIVDNELPPPNIDPAPNSNTAARDSNITLTAGDDIVAPTATAETVVVHAAGRGQLLAADLSITAAGPVVTLDPSENFLAGELISVSVTPALETVAGPVPSQVVQFRSAMTPSAGVFSLTESRLGIRSTYSVALGDLDADGDLDAFFTNHYEGNEVWLNDGGVFSNSAQSLGDHDSHDVALGDLDGDGDLDAFVAVGPNQGDRVWFNDGSGVFTDSGQSIGDSNSQVVALGDVDADGDLDAIVAANTGFTRLLVNDGDGNFALQQSFGSDNSYSWGVELGDLDSDGDLDAFITTRSQNSVWINENGQFADSGQLLPNQYGRGVALGDLDADGDLDAVLSGDDAGVWLNNGQASFAFRGGVNFGDTGGIALGDIDGDGDLDAITEEYAGVRIWKNEGDASFASAQEIRMPVALHREIALGDIDGDGDLDALLGSETGAGNSVLLNEVPPLTLTISDAGVVEGDGEDKTAEFTVSLSQEAAEPVTVQYSTADGSAEAGVDYTSTTGTLTFAPNQTTATINVTILGDDAVEGTERFFVSLSNPSGAVIGDGTAEGTIFGDDEPRLLWVDPAANSINSALDTNLTATFEEAIDGGSVDENSIVIHTARGTAAAAFSTAGATVTADLTQDFFPGELVSVSVTEATESVLGPVRPHVWQFRAGVSGGTGLFNQAATGLGDSNSFHVALGDLDGDGDLDAFVANDGPNRVWFNEGGKWADSGQELGRGVSLDVELGDLDNDGDLDAYVSNVYLANRIWWNDGGQFSDSGQRFEYPLSFSSSLGDVDGDGDLDILGAGTASHLLLNDGGQFTNSGQYLGYGTGITVGDVDGDGDLDAVMTFFDRIFLLQNDRGRFSQLDTGQYAGGVLADPILGDIDGDGDLDLFMQASIGEGNKILLNEAGNFVDSGQVLGDGQSYTLELGDLDGDGDLDFVVAQEDEGIQVWLNDEGSFRRTGQLLGTSYSLGLALGDLDGDGDLDAFLANYGSGNEVWEKGSCSG